MLIAKEFRRIRDATEYVKKILAEIPSEKELEFEVIHSLTEVECVESGGSWDDVSSILPRYLKDLDLMQGFIVYDDRLGPCWDYIEWEDDSAAEKPVYKPKDDHEVYVYSGEGFAVVHNQFAICENQFPIVILKKSFWVARKKSAEDILKNSEPGQDYTAKISPAIYIELFETEPKHKPMDFDLDKIMEFHAR